MWPNPKLTGNLVKFTAEIFNRKLYFMYSEPIKQWNLSEVHSESCQTSKMELFVKIVNS